MLFKLCLVNSTQENKQQKATWSFLKNVTLLFSLCSLWNLIASSFYNSIADFANIFEWFKILWCNVCDANLTRIWGLKFASNLIKLIIGKNFRTTKREMQFSWSAVLKSSSYETFCKSQKTVAAMDFFFIWGPPQKNFWEFSQIFQNNCSLKHLWTSASIWIANQP